MNKIRFLIKIKKIKILKELEIIIYAVRKKKHKIIWVILV